MATVLYRFMLPIILGSLMFVVVNFFFFFWGGGALNSDLKLELLTCISNRICPKSNLVKVDPSKATKTKIDM